MTYVHEHWKSSLKDHELKLELEDGHYEVWLMKKPGSNAWATQITFSPWGIALQGDTMYGNHGGLVSAVGYHRKWFAGRLTESYLCEKFLRRKFIPERAAETLQEWIEEADEYGLSNEQIIKIQAICLCLTDGEMTESNLWDEMYEIDYPLDDSIGYDYDPTEASALCAIQQKFSQLYTELQEKLRSATPEIKPEHVRRVMEQYGESLHDLGGPTEEFQEWFPDRYPQIFKEWKSKRAPGLRDVLLFEISNNTLDGLVYEQHDEILSRFLNEHAKDFFWDLHNRLDEEE